MIPVPDHILDVMASTSDYSASEAHTADSGWSREEINAAHILMSLSRMPPCSAVRDTSNEAGIVQASGTQVYGYEMGNHTTESSREGDDNLDKFEDRKTLSPGQPVHAAQSLTPYDEELSRGDMPRMNLRKHKGQKLLEVADASRVVSAESVRPPRTSPKRGRKEEQDNAPTPQPAKKQRKIAASRASAERTPSHAAPSEAESSSKSSLEKSSPPSSLHNTHQMSLAPNQKISTTLNHPAQHGNLVAVATSVPGSVTPLAQPLGTGSNASALPALLVHSRAAARQLLPNHQLAATVEAAGQPALVYTPKKTKQKMLEHIETKSNEKAQEKRVIEDKNDITPEEKTTKLKSNEKGQAEYVRGRDICTNGTLALVACKVCQHHGWPCVIWPENPKAKKEAPRCAGCTISKLPSRACTARHGVCL